MLRCFFFSIEGSNVVSFLVEFSDDFACIWSVNCFFFFSTQSFGQANRACLKKKHLLSLVTCCHWSQGKKKQLGNEAKSSFFPLDLFLQQSFFVCLAGSIYFVFFLFILLFFAFFCQMSNLCEKKKKKHPFKFRKLLQIKEKVS